MKPCSELVLAERAYIKRLWLLVTTENYSADVVKITLLLVTVKINGLLGKRKGIYDSVKGHY